MQGIPQHGACWGMSGVEALGKTSFTMRRSEINQLIRDASACFAAHGWALPPNPRWDVTDFGLGDWRRYGLVLINLTEQPEYCEKLMYVQEGMTTPAHYHKKKKEDIICRWGQLRITLWPSHPSSSSGETLILNAGERVTLEPGTWHEFAGASAECILGEVSTANDDLHDNFFLNPDVGRFPSLDEDEPPVVRLVSDR